MDSHEPTFDNVWQRVEKHLGLEVVPILSLPFVWTYHSGLKSIQFAVNLHVRPGIEEIKKEDFLRVWNMMKNEKMVPVYKSDLDEILKVHSKKDVITAVIIRNYLHWW